MFPSLLKQQKWYKYKRDAKVGDVVLRKDETAAGQTYEYARVTGMHVGTDGKVRAADIHRVQGPRRVKVSNNDKADTQACVICSRRGTNNGGDGEAGQLGA